MEEGRFSRRGARGLRVAALATLAVLVGPIGWARAATLPEAQEIVDRARVTFSAFLRNPDYPEVRYRLQSAKAVLIFPQVLRGGLIVGGSGGNGVLLVKDPKTGDWSQPAFYTIGSASIGLQIGGSTAEVVMLVMSDRGVDSLLGTSLNLGRDVSVAAGPYGKGRRSQLTADIISFARSKGLYAGLNLQGSRLKVRDDLNQAYYGRQVRPVDILVRDAVGNRGSRELRATLRQSTFRPGPT